MSTELCISNVLTTGGMTGRRLSDHQKLLISLIQRGYKETDQLMYLSCRSRLETLADLNYLQAHGLLRREVTIMPALPVPSYLLLRRPAYGRRRQAA